MKVLAGFLDNWCYWGIKGKEARLTKCLFVKNYRKDGSS